MRFLRLLIGVFIAFGLAAPLAHAQPPFDPGLARAIDVQERETGRLMGIDGVVGTAVGLGASGQPVVKIYTEAPGVPGLPRSLNGVLVVVEITGKIFALHHRPGHGGSPEGGGDNTVDPTARFARPVPIGVSTGHPNITAGTIGARVTDGTNVYALSNNHVYADENAALIGDPVVQPGPFDRGSYPDDQIGTLYAFGVIKFDGTENAIDAAIALSSTSLLGNATPSNGYGTPKSATVPAFIGQTVQKYGRTTGQTSGRIDAINATVNVRYESGVARFVRQIVIKPGKFSKGGDSGSLIVVKAGADDRRPVGLLFAGSLVVTIANPIDEVLSALGVTIDGE